MIRGWIAVASLWLTGCYSPHARSCAFRCSQDGRCPSGLMCDVDGFCRIPGEPCTPNDAAIVRCATPAECDDGNPCTQDICISNQCAWPNWPNSTTCNDNVFCNGIDECVAGECIHSMDACPNPASTCDEAKQWCACDDGNPCTGDDHIQSDGVTCSGVILNAVLCGACNSSTCSVCCAGVCRDMTNRDYCAGCSACSGTESCVYNSAAPCGWTWCCAN